MVDCCGGEIGSRTLVVSTGRDAHTNDNGKINLVMQGANPCPRQRGSSDLKLDQIKGYFMQLPNSRGWIVSNWRPDEPPASLKGTLKELKI